MPKYVASTTMEHADWNNSTIIAEDIPGRIRALRERENVIVWGNPTLVKTLMKEDLVDEYVLLVSPIVLAARRGCRKTEPGTRCGLSNRGSSKAGCSLYG
jgi:dihydrofolate reductase